MAKFEYEWWTVEVKEATGPIIWEIKAKNKDNAIKQINQMKKEEDDFVQRVRPDFETIIFWETLTLDHTGYKRRF